MRYLIYCRKSSEGEERQVLSLASQQEAIGKAFTGNPDVEIVGIYEEAKSAKTPGRPVFAEVVRRIEAGEADGIASWAPDRLARNSIDGGHIIYLLDRGVIRDLKFATYTFENNPQGKFMLGIMFNQSKYYSDALSENIKRGNETKVAMGWRPNRPPSGYLTCPSTRTIVPDPQLFPLVRRMFEMVLTGGLAPREVARLAGEEWGLRTRKRHVRGGNALTLSAVYKIFSNPFYKGQFLWNGVLYQGRHEPMLTATEFAKVQAILGRTGKGKPQKHHFPFTGLIRCGGCGLMVTAESRRNAYNIVYTYYHCTRRRAGRRCSEKALNADDLLDEFAHFLESLRIAGPLESWIKDNLKDIPDTIRVREAVAETRRATVSELATQLQELSRLRVRRMIDDDDFLAERARLMAEREVLIEQTQTRGLDTFELFQNVVSFSNYAADWFRSADPDTQRQIVKTVGSNFSLKDKKLSGEALKPFVSRSESAQILQRCTVGEDVRTKTALAEVGRTLRSDLEEVAASPEGAELLARLKALHQLFAVQANEPVRGATRKAADTARKGVGS